MRIGMLVVLLLLALPVSAGLQQLRFITEEYPPYNYSDNGQLKGIAIELLEQAFAAEGLQLQPQQIELLPWARGYDTALSTANTVLFSTNRTAARETLFQWAGPISADRVVLMGRASRTLQIDSIEQLNASELQIVAIREDVGAQRLQELGVDPDRITLASNNTSALAMLEAGRVDLWAYGEDVAYWLMRSQGIDPSAFEAVYTLTETYLYFALNADTDPRLTEQLQQAIDRSRDSATQLRFLTEEYPPFNYLDEQQQVAGIATTRLRTMLEDTGLQAEFQLLPWARAYTEARLNENTCVYSTTRTPEREAKFHWLGPLHISQWGAFSLPEAGLQATQLDQLDGLRIGSFREDAVGQYVAGLGHQLILATTDRENLTRLRNGLIDVWVTGVTHAQRIAADEQVSLTHLFTFNEVPLYLACHRDISPGLIQRMQHSLEQQDASLQHPYSSGAQES